MVEANKGFVDSWCLDTTCAYEHNYNSSLVTDNFRNVGPYILFGDINNPLKIMCYGGSTTSSITGSRWAELLYQLLKDDGVDACVLNGGVGGYNSWAELNKMMRDLPVFQPNIVLSYSGLNDMPGTAHINPKNPYINGYYVDEILKIAKFKGGLHYPLHREDHAGVWLTRSQQMSAICNIQNIHFMRILQPSLGYGSYAFDMNDPIDKELSAETKATPLSMSLRYFYTKIKADERLNRLDFIYDYTLNFDGLSRLFNDFRHPNKNGYLLIASSIKDDLKRANAL